MDHSKQLGEERIKNLLIKFSVPAIIGMLVNASYNIIDRIFIGRGVGSLGIAGVTIGFPMMILIMGFGMLIGLGTTSLISIRLGEQKKNEAELIMANGTVMLIGSSLVLTVIGLLFLDPLLVFFGASGSMLPYAREYMRIILWGAVFQGIGFGMNNFIRAEGNPKIAMFTMLISAVLNTILDPIFIFVFDMGISGAASATVISQAVSAIWVMYYFLYGSSSLRLRVRNLKLQAQIVKKILQIGSAPFAMQVAASIMGILLNHNLVTYGGDVAVSAMGIVHSIAMMILMPIFGINQGAQPIIGYNFGAGKYDRVKKTMMLGIIAATGVVLIGYTIIRLFPAELIGLFNKDDLQLMAIGTEALEIFFFFLPLVGFQVVSAGYFQAVGKPKQAMLLSLSRQVLLLIPALIILPKYYALRGVFMAIPFADLFAVIITGIWIYIELKYRLINKEPHLQT